MATSQLSLYNGALELCGEAEPLTSLSENRPARRYLDAAWDNDAIRTCLEQGQWNFAIRSIELPYTSDLEPAFGYTHVYLKPDDFVRTVGLSNNESFDPGLNRYLDEGDYWHADEESLFIRYVSDDPLYGFDYARWPKSFARFVEAYLASRIIMKLTGDKERWAIVEQKLREFEADALAKDAIAEAVRFAPTGSWVRSRGGYRYRDHPRGRLIG
jgi:hypothetical protein